MTRSYLILGIVIWCLMASVGSALAETYRVPANNRVEKTINREWTFNYLPAEDADRAECGRPSFDDSSWPAVSLPHTWSTYETTGKVHPFIYDASEKQDGYWWNGWGWYRKHFSIGRDQVGRRVFVEFDGVQKYCKVFLNGKLIGDHKGGYDGFYFDLTDGVQFGADNVLTVAVNNRQNDANSIPPMSAGNFNVYGGIYRDARIVIKDALHIPFQGAYQHQGGTFVTTPKVSEESAEVRVRTWVRNAYAVAKACELRTTIVNAEGVVVGKVAANRSLSAGELAEFEQTAEVARPQLWSPEIPYVYAVYSDVVVDSAVVDHFQSPLGIREYHWDFEQDRLILNGKKVIIHGTNRHQEWPWLGDATLKWMQLKDMWDIRVNLNNNFMRTAHYPNDPAIYDFCDRHGIIVIEELPNIKRQKFNPEVQVQQLTETIRRDRNHPSIFFWSMGNETDDAVDSKYVGPEDTTRLIHARDIYNDSAGKFVNTTSKQIALESLLWCTIRGWYNSDVKNLEPKSGQQAGTETWDHDRAQQDIMGRNKGRTPDDRANLNTWLYEDHGCNRQYVNAPLDYVNPKGWVDSWRTPKYKYYLWQAFYAEKPMVFIHPHFWQSQYVGQKKEIVVDSNCETVELEVNGKVVGTLKPTFENANVVRFKDVRIEPGVITATARRGEQTVTSTLYMAGPAARIVLSYEPSTIEAGLDSVAIVRADIVDAEGHHVYGATNSLQWSVMGPGTLIGAALYTSDTNKNEANEGTMYIDAPALNLVRSNGKAGEIHVRVRSPGLAAGEVAIVATAAGAGTSIAIVEPPLPDTKRHGVAREDAGSVLAGAAVVGEMQDIDQDVQFSASDADGYAREIDRFLREKNPKLDFGGPEYVAIVPALAQLLEHNKGSLVRDDFNFIAGFFNDCRQINGEVDRLKLPGAFKRSLRDYYARTMITRGEARTYATEVVRLRLIPDGKVVIAAGSGDAARMNDVLYADKADLREMIALAEPEFQKLDAGGKQRACDAVAAINPGVRRSSAKGGGKPKTPQGATYEVEVGQAVLVPAIGFLKQPRGTGHPETEIPG